MTVETTPIAKTLEAEAFRLAASAHMGQVDKAGKPYIEHLTRVRDNLVAMFPDADDKQKAAAFLHDTIEDAGLTMQALTEKFGAGEATSILSPSLP